MALSVENELKSEEGGTLPKKLPYFKLKAEGTYYPGSNSRLFLSKTEIQGSSDPDAAANDVEEDDYLQHFQVPSDRRNGS